MRLKNDAYIGHREKTKNLNIEFYVYDIVYYWPVAPKSPKTVATGTLAVRIEGLERTLSSGKQDYESINLPANYIKGFPQAVQ